MSIDDLGTDAKMSVVERVTFAYESGVGHALRTELNNPFPENSIDAMAWDEGRLFGKEIEQRRIDTQAATARVPAVRLGHDVLPAEPLYMPRVDRISTRAEREAEAAKPTRKERALRYMLADAVGTPQMYRDDGERQDNGAKPYIDFMRDDPADIKQALYDRGLERFKREVTGELPPFKIEYRDYGMAWTHNMPCPILGDTHSAVLDTNIGRFMPSWEAQKQGWVTVQITTRFQKWAMEKLFPGDNPVFRNKYRVRPHSDPKVPYPEPSLSLNRVFEVLNVVIDPSVREAAIKTRADLGADEGTTNYPLIRRLLGFVEHSIMIHDKAHDKKHNMLNNLPGVRT